MRLDEAQIAEYDRRGLLFFSALLQEAETAELQTGLTDILNRAGPEIIREKEDPAAVRLAFGAHVYSEPFGRLIRHPDILRPVRQLLQDEVYLHQSRVNPKQGFAGGAAWDWHQDFPGWHYADGMPEPRCVMVAVLSTIALRPLRHYWWCPNRNATDCSMRNCTEMPKVMRYTIWTAIRLHRWPTTRGSSR